MTPKLRICSKVFGFVLLNGLVGCSAFPNFPFGSTPPPPPAAQNYYEFRVKETSYDRLCRRQSILTVNGMFPGPEIHVISGDTVYINVYNDADQGITMHWHGVMQLRNSWFDGPAYITQCPIPPGDNFTYKVSPTTEEGTLWWHAHIAWARNTVHGMIRIYPKSNYPFQTPDGEIPIIFGSWFKGNLNEMVKKALESGGDFNVADALTINGQPGTMAPCSSQFAFRQAVRPGKTYLMRMVNAAMNEVLFFAIADHELTVVGMDGAYVKPFGTKYIIIGPGQTLDALITADQPPSAYFMAAYAFTNGGGNITNATATAILNYDADDYQPPEKPILPILPARNDSAAVSRFTGRLRSLASEDHPADVPQHVDRKIFITVASNNNLPCPRGKKCSGPKGNMIATSLNNISFKPPTSAYILDAYYRKNSDGVYDEDFPDRPEKIFDYTGTAGASINPMTTQGTRVISVKFGEVVEIIFQSVKRGPVPLLHPMHLHGYNFYLIGAGRGNFNEARDQKIFNLNDPAYLNTALLSTEGFIVILFKATNPGVWFLHCHLERHTSWGMETVIIVKDGEGEEESMLPPPPYMPECT